MTVRILFLLLSIYPFLLQAQEKEVLGRIVDRESQKPIHGAQVSVAGTTVETSTNQQGYFKFSIPVDKSSLTFSHISYQTLTGEIPSTNRILIKMDKEFQKLVPIYLTRFELTDLPPVYMDTSISENQKGQGVNNAEYPGSWQYFYNKVASVLKVDSIIKKLPYSSSQLKFSVELDGSTNFVSLQPENDLVFRALKDRANEFSKWKCALQNNLKVIQYFELPIIFEDIESIYTVLEETAVPEGGMPAFYQYVKKEMKYPKEARQKGIEGKVFVQFIISADGTISDAKVLQGIGFGCDEEAIRIVLNSAKWKPGKQRGKPVKQRYTLPIVFKYY